MPKGCHTTAPAAVQPVAAVLAAMLLLCSCALGASNPGGEALFACGFGNVPIDAAMHVDPGATGDVAYIFVKNKYWTYDASRQALLASNPGTAISTGFPGVPDDLDAALDGGTKWFFFKGSQYWRYTSGVGLDSGYPALISGGFPGLPSDMDAAEPWSTYYYFYYGSQYYKLDGSVTGPTSTDLPFTVTATMNNPFVATSLQSYLFHGVQVSLYKSGTELTAGSPYPICGSCQGTTSITSGVSGSIAPFTLGVYTNYQTCGWLFNFAQDGKISVTFSSFSTESCCDKVTIYDGETTSATPLLNGHGGSSLPPVTTSSGSRALVQFTSDLSTVGSGFAFDWEYFIRCPDLDTFAFGVWTGGVQGYRTDVRTAVCNQGYALSGDTTRTCQGTATWSNLANQVCSPLPCSPTLAAPVNGTVSSTTGSTGDSSTFSCNQGYSLSGSSSRTCLSDSTWSGSDDQVCNPNPCSPALSAPPNGEVSSTSGSTGDTSTFSCNSGFVLTGTAARTCLASGQWSGLDDQACTGSPCSPDLTVPVNGSLTCTSGTTGSTCTYGCDTGFTLSGSASRTCQADTTWTGSDPTCTPNACSTNLISPAYGSVSSSSGVTGSVSVFSCSAGYTLSGTSSRTCLASGDWSGLDDQLCNPIPCPSLTHPADGSVSITTGGVYEDVAVYTCNTGWTLVGDATRLCQIDGSWAGVPPACDPNACPSLPTLPNGIASPGTNGATGDSVTYACNGGYDLTGTAVRTCTVNGTWTGLDDAACALAPDHCPDQTAPSDGSLDSLTRTVGGAATFSCLPSFSLIGSASRTCQPDGSWSGTLPICTQCSGNCATCVSGQPTNCTSCVGGWELGSQCNVKSDPFCPLLLPPLNGTLSGAPCAQTVDTVCGVAACDPGFVLVGSTSRTCQSSAAWSGSPTVCAPCSAQCGTCSGSASSCDTCAPGLLGPPACATPVTCPVLAVPAHGSLSSPFNVSGTAVFFSCDPGFNLTAGSSVRVCTPSGLWSGTGPAVCTGLSCPDLTAPVFGSLSATSGVTGDVITVSCEPGYALAGQVTRTCQPTQVWSGSDPVCSPNGCSPTLTAPTHGAVSRTTGVTHDVAVYSCNAGFTLSGNTSVTCTTSGAWSSGPPVCVGDPCGSSLAPPVNGNVSSPTGVTGTIATFSCNEGFELIGTATRTCQSDGTWSGSSSPTCSTLDCPSLSQVQSPPSNGRLTCEGAQYLDECVISCNSGYAPFGTTSRTCLGSGAWSGDTQVLCSDANATASIASFVPPVSITAGSDWAFSLGLYRSPGVPATATENVIDVLRDLGGATFTSALKEEPSLTAPGEYAVTAAVPTTAGTYQHRILVNGVPTGGPSSATVVVVPAAPSGVTSTASGPALTAAELDVGAGLSIVVRDVYDNVAATTDPATVTVVAKVGDDARDLAATTQAAGHFGLTFTPWRGGVFTLSVSVQGEPLPSSPWVVFVESKCPPGQYAVEETGPCEACPVNTYTDTVNAPSCTACPAATSTQGVASANTVLNCTCEAGFYALDRGVACIGCPVGGVCDGGTSLPRAQPGFSPSSDPTIFLECDEQAAACLGDGKCRAGYRGRMCSDCTSGYYKISTRCYKCRPTLTAILVTVFMVALFLFCCLLVWLNTRNNKFYGLAAFMIGFNTLQILAVYGDLALAWPEYAAHFFNGLTFVNLNMELTSPECSLSIGNIWLMKWLLTMALPVFVILPFFIIFLWSLLYIFLVERFGERVRASKPQWYNPPSPQDTLGDRLKRRLGRFLGESIVKGAGMRAACGRAYWQLLIFCYMPLCHMTLRYLDCRKTEDGLWVMADAPTTECYTSSYWSLVWLVCLAIVVYCIGIPVAVSVLLRRKRAALDPFVFMLKYGFLIARFHDGYYLFEPMGIQARKFAVVLCTVMFRAPLVKASTAALVLLTSLTHVAYAHPYRQNWHNLLAVSCLFAGLIVLLGGTITYSSSMRDTLILGGLSAEIVLIVAGIVYDMVVTARRDKEDLDALESAGGFEGSRLTVGEDIIMDNFSGVTFETNMGGAQLQQRASQAGISSMDCASLDSFDSTPQHNLYSTPTMSMNNPVLGMASTPPPPAIATPPLGPPPPLDSTTSVGSVGAAQPEVDSVDSLGSLGGGGANPETVVDPEYFGALGVSVGQQQQQQQ